MDSYCGCSECNMGHSHIFRDCFAVSPVFLFGLAVFLGTGEFGGIRAAAQKHFDGRRTSSCNNSDCYITVFLVNAVKTKILEVDVLE